MPDLVNVTYARTGRSIATDGMGMREMQARAFAAVNRVINRVRLDILIFSSTPPGPQRNDRLGVGPR
jgi:hypothetical protein